MKPTTLRVNGEIHSLDVDPSTPLIYVLRNELGLTGAKLGCGLEQCGACAVLVDGKATLGCVAPVADFEGAEIVTIEGAGYETTIEAVKRAFVAESAAQCGYCTPGIVIAVTGLLLGGEPVDDDSIRRALARHLCRCGSHARVIKAARGLADAERDR